MKRALVTLVCLVALGGVVWAGAVLLRGTGFNVPDLAADRSQPVQYPHDRHLALGMECEACHTGAREGRHAGIPPTSFCANCHLVEPQEGESPGAKPAAPTPEAMRGFLERGEEIPWRQFQREPRHVYFSHRLHAGVAKIDCEDCHGDMKQVSDPVTRAVFPRHLRGMKRCASCHIEEHVTVDCLSCHR